MRLSGSCPTALSLSEVWLVVLAAIFLACSSGECNEFCRTDFDASAAECDSDVFLGSILSVHAGNDSRCEEIISKQLHVAVAMQWAMDRLNTPGGPSNVSFVPGVKLGLRLMDDCGLEVKAAGHVVNLLESQDLRCPSNASSAGARSTLAAVVAASASNTTRLAARLLATHNVSLVSASSSLAELYNKSLHYNVINTLPSEAEEDQAILSLMLRLRWTYVIGMYFDDAMRRTRYTAFKASAAAAGVCVADDFPLVTHSAAHFRESLSDAIKKIFFLMDRDTPEDQIAVVFFGTARMARFIFQIVTADQTTMNNWRWIHRIHFVFPSSVGVDEQLLRNAAPYNSRIFVLSPAPVTAPASFRQHLVSVLNSGNSSLTRERYGTWVQEYMTQLHGCTSGRQDCQVSVDDVTRTGYLSPYVKSAIDSVCYAASVVRTAHAQLCAGPGMCPALRRLLNDRNSLLSRFTASPHLDYNAFETDHSMDWPEGRLLEDDGGDLVKKGPLYEIYHRYASRFVKIGEYSKNNLSLDENIVNTVPLSVCKSICPRCLQTRSMPHVVLSGDVYILGFFTLHERGQPWDRFTCGHFRVDGGNFPSFFAFLNAIQELHSQSQVKFGAIAVDDCNDPARASLVLDNILSGRQPILDPVTGDVINASKIVAVLGPESSSTGLALLPVLMESQIPVVFPFASSTDFDDSVNYPYALRAVPKNQLQINAIAQAVDVLNVSFIGVVYSDDNQGIRSLELLQEWARAANVCVSPPQAVSEEATGEELIVALRQATERGSRLVVVLSSPATARHILDLQPQRHLRQILFLAGYRWGLRRDLLEGTRGEAARGALIFALDSTQRPLLGASLPAFLASLSSSTATPGSLLEAFFQAAFQCNKVTGFVKPFDRNCADDLKLTTEQIQMFVEDERVMQTQIAVASLAKGYEEVWQKKGCHRLRFPCTRLDPNDVTAAVTSARVKDLAGGTFQPFTSDRTGSHDLSLYNVKQVNSPESTFTFAKVGHYDVRRGNLTFDRRDVTVYNEYGAVVPLPEISCHLRRGCAQQCRDEVLAPPVLLSTPSPPDPRSPPHASISPHALDLVRADIEVAGVTLAVCIMTLALVAYGTFLVRKLCFLVKGLRVEVGAVPLPDPGLLSARNEPECMMNEIMEKLFHILRDILTKIKPEDFDVLGIIGNGAFGQVLAVRNKQTKEVIAIKIIAPNSPDQIRQMEREARLAFGLKHKNVMEALGVHCSSTHLYISMKAMCVSLQHLIEQEPIVGALAGAVSYEVMSGLAYLHSLSIVHLDVKPGNVLLTVERDGRVQVKLADFGHALVSGKSSPSRYMFGTLAYVSPEVFHGEEITPKADIWSWGLTLVAMAGGKFTPCYPSYYEMQFTRFSSCEGNATNSSLLSDWTSRHKRHRQRGFVDAPSCGRASSSSGALQRVVALDTSTLERGSRGTKIEMLPMPRDLPLTYACQYVTVTRLLESKISSLGGRLNRFDFYGNGFREDENSTPVSFEQSEFSESCKTDVEVSSSMEKLSTPEQFDQSEMKETGFIVNCNTVFQNDICGTEDVDFRFDIVDDIRIDTVDDLEPAPLPIPTFAPRWKAFLAAACFDSLVEFPESSHFHGKRLSVQNDRVSLFTKSEPSAVLENSWKENGCITPYTNEEQTLATADTELSVIWQDNSVKENGFLLPVAYEARIASTEDTVSLDDEFLQTNDNLPRSEPSQFNSDSEMTPYTSSDDTDDEGFLPDFGDYSPPGARGLAVYPTHSSSFGSAQSAVSVSPSVSSPTHFVVPTPEEGWLPLPPETLMSLTPVERWMVKKCLQFFPENRPSAEDLLGEAFHLGRASLNKLCPLINQVSRI